MLGWEADLVSRNVGVCLQTVIILWQNIRTHLRNRFRIFHISVVSFNVDLLQTRVVVLLLLKGAIIYNQ